MAWKGNVVFSHGKTDSRGVMIIFNPNKNIEYETVYKDLDGRVIIAKIHKNNQVFLLANIYGPNVDNPDFFRNLIQQIQNTDEHEFIIMGDFNIVIDPQKDRTDHCMYAPRSTNILQEFMEEIELVDIWRIRNPESRIFSWMRENRSSNTNKKISASRIDYAISTLGLNNKTQEVKYSFGYKTDHSLFTFELDLSPYKRGPGYWKFNNILLHDKSYVDKANEIIHEAKIKYIKNTPDKVMECCMDDLGQWSRAKAKNNAKEKKQKFNDLLKKIDETKSRIILNDKTAVHELMLYEKEIEVMLEKRTQASAFRSKAKILREFEKNSKYFFSLEKSNYSRKTMTRLKCADGTYTTDPGKILKMQSEFYKDLYTADDSVQFNFENKTQNKLTVTDRMEMDKEISMEELDTAVKGLKREKTPGNSGFTTEFFQFFWHKIREMYHNALMYAKRTGKLTLSARRGVITLIPKKADPDELKSWRPLTMLNIQYKILAKALANRLKLVFPELISNTQTGFMQERQISTTLRTTLDITKLNKSVSGYAIFLDFEKCFDRIAYNAITGSLGYLGFGKEFNEWVNLLLNGFQSKTSNNGYFSEYFNVTRSCHQGCPVAPLLFLACGEVMAREIKNKSTIHGITLNNLETVIAQFADDTQLFLDTKRSVEEVIKMLTDIETNTGLKVNYEKSSIHTINGAQKFECSKNFVWDPGGAKVLGLDVFEEANSCYERILEKAQKVLNQWSNQNLSVTGKVSIINTLIASLFVYAMQVTLDPEETFYKKFDAIVHKYLWKGKKAKIGIALLRETKENAGLNLADLRKKNAALKIEWLFRDDPFVEAQLQNIAPQELGTLFWDCNINSEDCLRYLNSLTDVNRFWKTVCVHWFNLRTKLRNKKEKDHDEIIWFNSEIKVQNKTLYNEKAVKAGCIFISDIIKDRQPLTFQEFTEKFGKCYNWFEYMALCQAIPKSKRENINTPFESTYEKMCSQTKRVNQIYKMLQHNEKKELEKMHKKFCKQVECSIEEYTQAFKDLYQVTDITKFRDFQYRILVNAIFTNNRLYHWKIVNTKICEYCQTEIQDVPHLMFECKNIRKIWNQFQRYIKQCMNVKDEHDLTWKKKNIMLNKVHPKANHIINFFTVIIKQLIFANKCLGRKTRFCNVVERIEEIYNMEKYNAMIKQKTYKFNKKWAPYDVHLMQTGN